MAGWAAKIASWRANDHAVAGLSEYCGIVSIWLAEPGRPRGFDECEGLARAWRERVAPGFEAAFGTMRKLGHMSNGEAVFKRA